MPAPITGSGLLGCSLRHLEFLQLAETRGRRRRLGGDAGAGRNEPPGAGLVVHLGRARAAGTGAGGAVVLACEGNAVALLLALGALFHMGAGVGGHGGTERGHQGHGGNHRVFAGGHGLSLRWGVGKRVRAARAKGYIRGPPSVRLPGDRVSSHSATSGHKAASAEGRKKPEWPMRGRPWSPGLTRR